MTRDLGRVGGSRAGRHAGRWTGRLVAFLWLAIATPAAAVQPTPDPTSYAECMRIYSHRADAATMCRRMFPLTRTTPIIRATPSVGGVAARTPSAVTPTYPPPPPPVTPPATPPAATPPSTSTQTPPATSTPPSRTSSRQPVDITPGVTKLLEAWASRPRTPKPPRRPPADPLAVIPEIQAACVAYAGNAERWRRCTSDAWNTAGLRGQPPLVLQVPPAPPPVYEPPPTPPTPVQPEPPVRTGSTPTEPLPPPVQPPIVEPEPPVAAVAPPPAPPSQPPVVAAPMPQPALPVSPAPSIPIWAWLVAVAALVIAAAAGGFGLAKLLGKARPAGPSKAEVAACEPAEVVLVADPGVVVLTPDGPPRAGMAVSMRFALDPGEDDVRLDYPSLETAP